MMTMSCKPVDFASNVNFEDERCILSTVLIKWVMTKWSKALLITVQMAKIYN